MRDKADHLAVPAVPGQSARVHVGSLAVAESTVLASLAQAAAGCTADDVAHGLLAPLLRLPGVRAGALVLGAGGRRGPSVVASAGYPCGSFDAGAVLPRDAGLPVTEAATSGRTVVRGQGPCWVAVPVRPGGALLLSLTGAPPAPADLARLEALGRAAGPALVRAVGEQERRDRLAVLESGLGCADGDLGAREVARLRQLGWEIAVHGRPYTGTLTGDVVQLCADDHAVWLVVADVSGRGAAAATTALRLRAGVAALAPLSTGPAALLRELPPALACGEETFVTALVLRFTEGAVTAATAGHPGPLLVTDVVLQPALEAGVPLGLGHPVDASETTLSTGGASLIVAHTDGLVDRGPEVSLVPFLEELPPLSSAAQAAELISAACDHMGPAEDDLSLVVLRRIATD